MNLITHAFQFGLFVGTSLFVVLAYFGKIDVLVILIERWLGNRY